MTTVCSASHVRMRRSRTADRTGCVDCADVSPAHHRGPTSGGVCEPCVAGKEPTANRASCALCGTVSAGSDGTCSVCADGFEPNAERTACVMCEVGFAGTGGQCDQCPAGQEPNADRTACQACAVGFAGTGGVCEQCAPGTEPDGSAVSCVSCAAGFAGSDGTCAVCVDGTEPNEDMTACQPCAPGWAGDSGGAASVLRALSPRRTSGRARIVRWAMLGAMARVPGALLARVRSGLGLAALSVTRTLLDRMGRAAHVVTATHRTQTGPRV